MKPPFYFQVLPLRAVGQPQEALTSYLMRLAELNLMSSVDALSVIFFPFQSRRITRTLSDYPPLSLSTAAEAAYCSEDDLLKMTFHHLGRKFARSSHPQALSRFLSGSIAPTLRFCPRCLQENLYYRLPWRFTALKGCSEHQCQLVDRCPYCGELLPILKAPLRVGICPACYGDLREASCVPLQEDEYRYIATVHKELIFFLTPQCWEDHSQTVIRSIGRDLLARRLSREISAVDLARELNVTRTVIEGIDRGNVVGRGCSFDHYRRYTDYMGLQLTTLFKDHIDSSTNL